MRKRTRTVQSKHPYEADASSEETICIKGAKQLSVEFDRSCCLHEKDTLQLFFEELSEDIKGRAPKAVRKELTGKVPSPSSR